MLLEVEEQLIIDEDFIIEEDDGTAGMCAILRTVVGLCSTLNIGHP